MEPVTRDTLSVIHSRKSVRHFTDRPVTRQQLETLLRAGMAAPSAVSKQPWAFVAITERQILERTGKPSALRQNHRRPLSSAVT
ncbi:nitroreductase family protein [Desulfonema ishimotonii]|uniref:Nitroreductase family protein n=2 Tax=Desulfonema ishimotonii TaxID=45657 RepID=A0A401FUC3_9BACT|nr:nitroreductase family protein [Desulfonema ishimotonii]